MERTAHLDHSQHDSAHDFMNDVARPCANMTANTVHIVCWAAELCDIHCKRHAVHCHDSGTSHQMASWLCVKTVTQCASTVQHAECNHSALVHDTDFHLALKTFMYMYFENLKRAFIIKLKFHSTYTNYNTKYASRMWYKLNVLPTFHEHALCEIA